MSSPPGMAILPSMAAPTRTKHTALHLNHLQRCLVVAWVGGLQGSSA